MFRGHRQLQPGHCWLLRGVLTWPCPGPVRCQSPAPGRPAGWAPAATAELTAESAGPPWQQPVPGALPPLLLHPNERTFAEPVVAAPLPSPTATSQLVAHPFINKVCFPKHPALTAIWDSHVAKHVCMSSSTCNQQKIPLSSVCQPFFMARTCRGRGVGDTSREGPVSGGTGPVLLPALGASVPFCCGRGASCSPRAPNLRFTPASPQRLLCSTRLRQAMPGTAAEAQP